MIRSFPRSRIVDRLMAGGSLTALALAVSFVPMAAKAQDFGTMVGMQAGRIIGPDGQVSVWTGADRPTIGHDTDGRPLMTIKQTQQKALLDWEDFRLKTNEVLEFQQQAANWIAVNRVHGNQAAEVNGEIRAVGKVYIFDDNGVLIGKDAKINTRALVTGRGFSDVNVDGNTTTIVQSAEKGLLDWSNMNVAAGEVLKFQQEKSNWIALNRSYNTNTTEIAGDVKANGNIYLVAPRGISVDGHINAQQVVLSSLFMRDDQFFGVNGGYNAGLISYPRDGNARYDPTFSNTWYYGSPFNPPPASAAGYNPLGADHYATPDRYDELTGPGYIASDPNDPLKYNVTIGRTGVVETGSYGKVMLFGPNVFNNGTINVKDEGQVILAAGENIFLTAGANGRLDAVADGYNPFIFSRNGLQIFGYPPQTVTTESWREFWHALGVDLAIGDTVPSDFYYSVHGRVISYFARREYERAHEIGYVASNEGIITSARGGSVDFRGLDLRQMGAVDMTSTALFRAGISFKAFLYDYHECASCGTDGYDTAIPGNGTVTFGVNSLTQITPDLDSTDAIPLVSGAQSVGSLTIQANSVDMRQDSLIYMPSGNMNVLLDAGQFVFAFGMNHGPGTNQGNEDGTRFLMDTGATIDLSGWKTTLDMGYQQVTGKLFAAQLADSPVQRDGPLYRKEITVDRRFGTNLANWQSFDNLSQGTLAQFLTNGGTFNLDVDDDFIMKSGSVIDVSGGVTTFNDGYVYTTLLRRLDGSVIDIREADPDELYMGLANEWAVYDTKWGRQESYYIPLVSSVQGKYETSYQQGGAAGSVNILAPDAVLQGTLKGDTVAGRYQRANPPKGGSFALNHAADTETEYVSNNVLITAIENVLDANFGMHDKLSDQYGDLFGVEFDSGTTPPSSDTQPRRDNTTLASADFFNRSTMGSYELNQINRVTDVRVGNAFVPVEGVAALVEAGADLHLANGASFTLNAGERVEFLGSIRTEGGDVSLSGMSLTLGADTRIDTRGSWYSDYEIDEPIALNSVPRIDGGSITLYAGGTITNAEDIGFVLPETAVLDTSGGAWVSRDGKMTGGKGGNLSISYNSYNHADAFDIGALAHARAYGLGGNGGFSFLTNKPIVLADALPDVDGQPADPVATLLFRRDFFAHSGFSAISLQAPSVTIPAGVQINASSATMQLLDQTLQNGRPPAYWTPSGTDIYDVTEIADVPLAQQPKALRRGMDINLIGTLGMGEGALLGTEIGGNITIGGNADIAGTILAPAGKITIGSNGDAPGTFVHIASTARLLAPGASLITWRGIDRVGHELVDGDLWNGGTIDLAAQKLTLDPGAVLDVSGTSAVFAIEVDDGRGGTLRQPTTLASNGGGIILSGQMMTIDGASYLARSGGAGARGGDFVLNWSASFGNGGGGSGGSPYYPNNGAMIDDFNNYFGYGYFYDKQGNLLPSLYGVDLSTIDWSIFGVDFQIAPGTIYHDRADMVGAFDGYAAGANGAPPVLIIGNADGMQVGPPQLPHIDGGLVEALNWLFQYTLPTVVAGDPIVTVVSPDKIGQGGFSSLTINSALGAVFSGNVNIGGRKADGSNIYDRIAINAARIYGREGADVKLQAGVVTFDAASGVGGDATYAGALGAYGVHDVSGDTSFTATADTLLQVGSASFYGFSDTNLVSGGDIRLSGYNYGVQLAPSGTLETTGKLVMKADQIYAGTGRVFTVTSQAGIEIQAQDDGGPINGSPYEAAAQLTFKAPTILQGGTIRSPLGTLNLEVYDNGTEGSNRLILAPGSITSVSAEGRIVPYGFTSNGDTWIDPFTGLELTTLPTKTVNLTGGTVDIQQGAVLDVSGGGDLYAHEFVAGVGGTNDWLTGYRDADYNWVSAPGQVYAVVPGYDGNIAPLGFGQSQIGVGDKVYLSGGSGLPAGTYVLMPAEYALLPGAFRVTLGHRGGDFTDAPLGSVANLTDGSSIQAGYRIDGASGARDQRNLGFQVMPGDTLRLRSTYIETTANDFFTSDAFLRKALRVNRPLADVPRIPVDGGSVVFRVSDSLNLDGTLKSSAAKGGRGGFADIAGSKLVVAGADTDLGAYDGYLVLDSDQLSAFGAESLLIGGVRSQGNVNLELNVTGTDVVIDNAGSTLFGPEMLFASNGGIDVKSGARIETRGTVSGSSGDIRVNPGIAAVTADVNNTPWDPNDDVVVHGVLDQGAVLRVSSGEQVDILRNGDAVNAMNALAADPARLAEVNAIRAGKGLAPLDPNGGLLTIDGGASIKSSRSVALDATNDTLLNQNATLQTQQLSAAASRVSIGAVPAGTDGLVFANGALGLLANATDLTLKSYSSIDFHGSATLSVANGLKLDAAEIRVIGGTGDAVKVGAATLTLGNSVGGTRTAVAGGATISFDATNLYVEGGEKWISGVASVSIDADQRVIGRGDTALHLPGTLSITAGGMTAESGARLNLDAAGTIHVGYNGNASLPVFQSFGGTLSLSGASIDYAGQMRITGGTINLQARQGDVVLGQDSLLDVTSNVSQFYDQSVGVGAGTINLVADRGNVIAGAGSTIDVSGTAVGGNGGTLSIRAGQGQARLDGTLRGTAAAGYDSASFDLLTDTLADFAGFNTRLDAGGFRQSRRFEINRGDVTIDGAIDVQNFAVIANDGAIDVTGTVATTGGSGGTIQLSAAKDVTLESTAKLLAGAKSATGSGGTVLLETTGKDGGTIDTAAGSLIDVHGTGEGGRLVRFRAPQLGGDIGIGSLGGSIAGARSVIAEGYRVYDGVSTIDQGVIDRVEGDAYAFMAAHGDAIRARLGGGVTLTAGIELRSEGDMTLATDWDLSGVRFGGAPGVLTLRAAGDLKLDANLTDGLAGGLLLNGDSWAFNLTAGANVLSPDSSAVLPQGGLADGKGSVIVGGTPDTIEYYFDPAYGNENRLYLLGPDGKFLVNRDFSSPSGYYELSRDPATGKYLDPVTGAPIEKDPATGDYVDTARYARRPLPWIAIDGGWGSNYTAFGAQGYLGFDGLGQPGEDLRDYIQWDNSTGYTVRTGTGAINVAAGRDLVLQERGSVIYSAGRQDDPLAGFYAPSNANYGVAGGDVSVTVAGSVLASGQTPQMPLGYLTQLGSYDPASGMFGAGGNGRTYDQLTWYVDYSRFEGGLGALGGGNIAITAGGDIDNLGVSIPDSGRVTGNIPGAAPGTIVPIALHLSGGGNLALRAGGNLYGGAFYVGSGQGDISIGGSSGAGSTVHANGAFYGQGVDIHEDFRATMPRFDLYPMFFTSSGQLDIRAGGDLNIESVMDPLIGMAQFGQKGMMSYTPDASVRLFSAGGDVTLWNNGYNLTVAYLSSGVNSYNPAGDPLTFYGESSRPMGGYDSPGWDLYPSKVSVVAATGDVRVLGGMTLAPAARGQLDLLAGGNVYIGYGTQAVDPFLPNTTLGAESQNYRSVYQGIYMSQANPDLIRSPLTTPAVAGDGIYRAEFRLGGGAANGSVSYFTVDNGPDLHLGDTQPVRIYAAGGNVITATTAPLVFPKPLWLQAEGNIYFPSYQIQHNNPNDVSIVRAGEGIYFDFGQTINPSNQAYGDSYGLISVNGPGRLEIEAGTDIWLPSNVLGITSNRISVYTGGGSIYGNGTTIQTWHPDEKAADIAISTGFNQAPSYQAFEDAYLNPGMAGSMKDYLIDADSGKSLYLFDRDYPRAQGATGEFATPEPREGLVNYVRRLQGLDPLKTKTEQLAYLDTAWSYWETLSNDYKTPFYRSVLFLELRTTGREANDPNNPRYDTSARGYDAIATLFPGAEKDADTPLAEGESRWQGNFETYASRVISSGGGKVEFVIPGGTMILANAAARAGETGQPAGPGDRGNALRAGILTTDGGEINILGHDNIAVNESRILTSKGGNVLIWSSWGDIAAGKGAKTSISPQFYNYALDSFARMNRTPAGLPTGAGIGTLATQPGTPPADVDLIAPVGIVDAGDAGIRVSGNFNVYAIEILGTDNIDVAGVATGLPVPPATPPNSLDVGEVGTKSAAVNKALEEAVSQVRRNAAILSPSIIEVRITGYGGECGSSSDPCTPAAPRGASMGPAPSLPTMAPVQVAMRSQDERPRAVSFDLAPQPLDQAVRAIGRASGLNILYDSTILKARTTTALRGSMTPEQALERLLSDQNLEPVRIDAHTIMLRRRSA